MAAGFVKVCVPQGVGVGVTTGVTVGDGVGIGVGVGVRPGVGVGTGVGVALQALGARIPTVIGVPVLKKPIVASV